MKPVWKYLFISFFSMIVIGYLVYALWYFQGTEKQQVCKELSVVITDKSERELITQKEIAETLELNGLNPIGKTLKKIRTESIEEVLRKNPMIRTVECFTTPDGAVDIQILQRSPKFRVVGFGSYYVDVDRKTMPVSLHSAAYVPVVSGRVTVSMAIGKMFDFITFLEENPFWNAQIEQIFVRDDLKIELVPRVGDAVIVLGTLDNFQSKLEKLRKLYVNGFNKMGWNRYRRIDLEYKNLVVCTKAGTKDELPVKILKESKDSIIASKL
jgi:cell division protein FtsQ